MLLEFTSKGIYCKQANIYIDPWRKVDKAIITHGHSDHARSGMNHYLCHKDSASILKLRLGKNISIETKKYHESFQINGVSFSFHPAGHCIGSAQVRVEYKGEIWVASGDYKTEDDGLTTPFEPVKCHAFITESTFGMPVYNWRKQEKIYQQIINWQQFNQTQNRASIIYGYSLGKAQRLIHALGKLGCTIYCHDSIYKMNHAIESSGIKLPQYQLLTEKIPIEELIESVIIAPPNNVTTSKILQKVSEVSIAMASGWMGTKSARYYGNVHAGFALSDHADWKGLLNTVKETGAEKVIVTHGFTSYFSQYLNNLGINSITEKTAFIGEENDQITTNIKSG